MIRHAYKKGEPLDLKAKDGHYFEHHLNLTSARVATAALKAERRWINNTIEALSSVTIELVEGVDGEADTYRATTPDASDTEVGEGATPVEALFELWLEAVEPGLV